MSAHNAASQQFSAVKELPDPGDAKTIVADRDECVVNIVSAAAETRTLGRPTKAGCLCTLYCRTAVGTITLTVTGGYNADGDTTFSLTTAGQYVMFESVETSTSGTFVWLKISDYSTGNLTPAEAAILDGMGSTQAEIDRAADISTREVIISNTGTDTTVTVTAAAHAERTQVINQATKLLTINLPAASGTGARYKWVIGTSITNGSGNSVAFVATGAHLFGTAFVVSDDTVTTRGFAAAGSTSIIFNGTTTGGIKGAVIEIEDVATNVLIVTITGAATGSEATPFA
jgi:hypothetical protein